MNIDVEPNILLILLGSLFILIGASGKIFIEKFSVALASVASRLLVAVLGLCMLGIGIVGPSNLFSDKAEKVKEQSMDSLKSTVIDKQEQVPWFNIIEGTYTGIVTSTGADCPVKTTFNIDKQGVITGSYVIEELGKMLGGKLNEAKILGHGSLEFRWEDNGGSGILRVTFAEDLNSFSGNWGDSEQLDLTIDGMEKKNNILLSIFIGQENLTNFKTQGFSPLCSEKSMLNWC